MASPAQSPAPSPAASPARPQTILRLGRPDSPIAYWPVVIAEQQGFLGAEAISLRLEDPERAAALQALTAGRLDVAILPAAAVGAAPNAAEIVMVAGIVNRPIEALVIGRDVNGWADLRGQVIAVRAPNDISAALAARILEAHAVRRADVTFLGVEDEDGRAASVLNGTAAAALVGPPRDARMVARGFRSLGRVVDVTPEMQQEVVTVSRRWSQDPGNADALTRFLRALVRAEQWIRSPANREAAITSLAGALSLTRPEAQQVYDLIGRVGAISADGTLNRPGLTTALDLVSQLPGQGRALPAADRLVDTTFIERAAR